MQKLTFFEPHSIGDGAFFKMMIFIHILRKLKITFINMILYFVNFPLTIHPEASMALQKDGIKKEDSPQII